MMYETRMIYETQFVYKVYVQFLNQNQTMNLFENIHHNTDYSN